MLITDIDLRYDLVLPSAYCKDTELFQGYGPAAYKVEVQSAIDTMRSQGLKTQGQIIAPNVNRDWTLEDVFDTNFLVDFAQELGIISVEKYITCYAHPHRSDLLI